MLKARGYESVDWIKLGQDWSRFAASNANGNEFLILRMEQGNFWLTEGLSATHLLGRGENLHSYGLNLLHGQ